MTFANLGVRVAGRRARERGATLTLVTVVTASIIVTLATVYLSSAEQSYRLAMHRVREAQGLAAADGGLAEALAKLEKSRAERLGMELAREGTRVRVVSSAGPQAEITVTATGGEERAPIVRKLTASVDLAQPGPLRIARIRRE